MSSRSHKRAERGLAEREAQYGRIPFHQRHAFKKPGSLNPRKSGARKGGKRK